MNGLIVRASTEADVARCAEIYGHHVLYGTASFEVDPPDLAEMKVRRAAVLDLGLPHLVAEGNGRVLGYAYAGKWRPRPAYAFSVEDSIYIDKDAVGQGVGKALLPVLVEQCTALGKRQMVAVIGDSAQTPSIRLHASCGFEMVGTLRSIGFKFGRWLDGVLMQRPLGPGDTLPPADTLSTADTGRRSLKDLLLVEHPRGELNIPSRRKS